MGGAFIGRVADELLVSGAGGADLTWALSVDVSIPSGLLAAGGVGCG